MKGNIIIANCKASEEVSKAFKMLKKKPEGKGFEISHGAIVKMEGGKISLVDGFISNEGDSSLAGGVIGGLVGLLAGPLGALIGGGIGALIGNSIDKEELKGTSKILEKASECLVDGETALLLMAKEKDEKALDEKLKEYEMTLTRLDIKEVAREIKQAKKERNRAKKQEKMKNLYGENKQITDGDYDKSLAVKCVNGTFVGREKDGVIVYRGIPFVGKQPIGDLRWKAPVDVTPDDNVYEAYYSGKSPCQDKEISEMEDTLANQGEDCLYLNVWKTKDTSAEKKPVMVWIHGGAFEFGAAAISLFECDDLLRENPDVIVVTVAYRLGVFGYFHLSHLPDGKDYPDAQNLGPLDQLMGLKWVHENIAAFGGDPDNVTIFGESAGAGSVTLLPLLKGSQEYFQKVIAQSGSPTLTRTADEAIECTDKMMEVLGCKSVADLMKVDARAIADASEAVRLRICPERDGIHLPIDPYEAYENGAGKDVIFLQGCNKNEFDWFADVLGDEGIKLLYEDRKKRKFVRLTDEEKAKMESFLNDAKGEGCEAECRLFDQLWFNAPVIRMSECQTKAGGKSYTYFFTAADGHGMELGIIFNHPESEDDTDNFDEAFCKTMRKMWIQFAKTGNPSLSEGLSPDGKTHEWPLYDLENKRVMILEESNIHAEKEAERKIVDWDRTYFMTKHYLF